MSWREAEDYCNSIGGHLPSINSDLEWKFINNIIVTLLDVIPSNAIFIGLIFNYTVIYFILILRGQVTNLHYSVFILCLQMYRNTWVDGSIVSYQNWFHPVKHAPFIEVQGICHNQCEYITNWTYVNTTDIIGNNKYFHQPMIMANASCTAILHRGAGKMKLMQWIKVSCENLYPLYTILCEINRTKGDKFKHDINLYLNSNTSFSIRKYKNLVILSESYCSVNRLAINGLCWRFEPPYIVTYNITAETCLGVHEDNISDYFWHNFSYVFQFVVGTELYKITNNSMEFTVCYETMKSKSFVKMLGFFQCLDGTFIREQYECDGEADCPD